MAIELYIFSAMSQKYNHGLLTYTPSLGPSNKITVTLYCMKNISFPYTAYVRKETLYGPKSNRTVTNKHNPYMYISKSVQTLLFHLLILNC